MTSLFFAELALREFVFHSQYAKMNILELEETINIRTPAIIGRSYTETKPRRYWVMPLKGRWSPPYPATEKIVLDPTITRFKSCCIPLFIYLYPHFRSLLSSCIYVQCSASFVYTCPPCLPLSFSCLLLCPPVLYIPCFTSFIALQKKKKKRKKNKKKKTKKKQNKKKKQKKKKTKKKN